jgi:hypothetical protein
MTDKGCKRVSDHCADWDSWGECTKCYKGYDLKDGDCVWSPFNDQGAADEGCAKWDWDNQVCLQCSERYIMTKSGCKRVSDHCADWDNAWGECTKCYKGYDLKDGECVWSSLNDQGAADEGCAKWDWDNQVCLQCSIRYEMTDKGCKRVSDHCADWDSWGECTKCYKGYDLKDGDCVWSPFNDQGAADEGCAKWDWDNQVCLQCSERYIMTKSGCKRVSDHCADWDNAWGECTKCYKGYDLKDGECVWSSLNDQGAADEGCAKWDWDNQVCLQCSIRYEMTDKGCKRVSDHCADWDSWGECTKCYKGYDLKDGDCVWSPFNDFRVKDKGCKIWNWD